jgi:uncharacterized membrane protein YagU involved in acid resistance
MELSRRAKHYGIVLAIWAAILQTAWIYVWIYYGLLAGLMTWWAMAVLPILLFRLRPDLWDAGSEFGSWVVWKLLTMKK